MADGEINRNGATIRIDDNGGVQVEPADGQEVEYSGPDRGTEAIRDSVSTVEADMENLRFGSNQGLAFKKAGEIMQNLDDTGGVIDGLSGNVPVFIELDEIDLPDEATLEMRVNQDDGDNYDYTSLAGDGSITATTNETSVTLTTRYGSGRVEVSYAEDGRIAFTGPLAVRGGLTHTSLLSGMFGSTGRKPISSLEFLSGSATDDVVVEGAITVSEAIA